MAANIEVRLDPKQVQDAIARMNAAWAENSKAATASTAQSSKAFDSLADRIASQSERATHSVVSLTASIAKQAESFIQHNRAVELGAAALASVGAAAIKAGGGYLAHRSTVDAVTNSYRALRIVLSPTIFTASTIAAGLLVEELSRLTLAQAKQNQQQILFARSNGLSVDTVQQLSIAVKRVDGDMSTFVDGLKKFQSANPGATIADFGRELEQLGKISNPTERIQATLEEFGASIGERLLPHLDERFAINAQRIRDWGVSLSSTARTNLDQFSRDSHDFSLGFKEDMDFLSLGATKMKLSVESAFASAYVFLKQASGAVFSTPGLPGGLSIYGEGYQTSNRLFGAGSQTGALFGYERLGSNDINSYVQGLSTAAPKGLDVTGAALQGGMPARDSQLRDLTGNQVRDRELDSQRAIVANALTKLFPQTQQDKTASAKLTEQERALYAQQGVMAQQRVSVLEAQVKQEQDAAAAARQAQATFASIQATLVGYSREAQLAGKSGVEASNLRRRFALEDLRNQGASAAQLAAANRSLTQPLALEASLQTVSERAARDQVEQTLQGMERDRGRKLGSDYGSAQYGIGGAPAFFAKAVDDMRAAVETDRAIANISFGAERTNIQRQADRSQRIAGLQGDDNSPSNAERGYRIQLELASQLFNLDMRRASVEEDLNQKRIDQAKAFGDFSEAIQNAQLDRELKLLELDKQRTEEIQRTASGLFHTLFTKPQDFGKQLRSTVTEATLKPITEGLGEITAQALKPIIYGPTGQGGFAGALNAARGKEGPMAGPAGPPFMYGPDGKGELASAFKGAVGGKQDPIQAAIEMNTAVTAQNSAAIMALTGVMASSAGISVPNVSAPGIASAGIPPISTPSVSTSSRAGAFSFAGFGRDLSPTIPYGYGGPTGVFSAGSSLPNFGGGPGVYPTDFGAASAGGAGGYGGGYESTTLPGLAPNGAVPGFAGGNPASMLGPGGTAGFASGSLGLARSLGGAASSTVLRTAGGSWQSAGSGLGAMVGYKGAGQWQTGPYSEGQGFSGAAEGITASPLAGTAGVALAKNGLVGERAGTWGGVGEATAGGALIGMQYGGPIGAAVGAAVGFFAGVGEMLAGVESPQVEAKRLVKQRFGINIDEKMANQIVAIAKQSYAGHVSLAVNSPQVRQMLGLYAAGTGQKFPLSASTPYAGSLVEQGGKLYQQANTVYGQSYAYNSNLPLLGGGTPNNTVPSSGGPTSGNVQMTVLVNGQGTTDYLQGNVFNAEYVGAAFNQHMGSGAGPNTSAMVQQPGLITA